MNIETIPNLVRDSRRFHQIVSTFTRYGLAPWLSGINASWIKKQLVAADGRQISDLSQGARLREAFTELGTTFIIVTHDQAEALAEMLHLVLPALDGS